MSAVKEVFSILAARAEKAIPVHNCDYTDEATGLLICGKCRSPKQCRPFPDSDFAAGRDGTARSGRLSDDGRAGAWRLFPASAGTAGGSAAESGERRCPERSD